MNTIKPTPTYYVRHPDDTYSVADPQPTIRPVKQEPVCSVCCKYHDKENPVGYFLPPANELDSWEQVAACDNQDAVPLYASPVQQVDLTDDELKAALEVHQVGLSVRIGRIAIAAYKEKNRG